MKRAFACTVLLCLAFGCAVYAQEQNSKPTQSTRTGEQKMTKDEIDVQATIEKMTAAFQQNQIDTVMSTYERGAVVLFEPGQPATGDQQLRQMFGGMAAAKPVFTYSGHEVVVSGDTAIHIAPWHMTGHAPDGKEITQSGLSIAVLRRQTDGSWKMVIDNPHGSRLLPPTK